MRSARQKLREYRDEDHRSHDEIVELWTNILSKCDLTTLGDEECIKRNNKNLLELIDLNTIKKEKIYLILTTNDSCCSRLSNDMIKMKNDIILLNEKQLDHQSAELDQLRKPRTDNPILGSNRTRSDFDRFLQESKTQSSEKILREAFAHLLIPFIEKLKQEFEKKNEEQTNSKQYDFLKSYNKYNLRQLKTGVSIEKKSVLLINDVINDFAEQSKISRSDFIDLLVDKSC
ncbi:unnamed protein product [Rotaria socialis]|uniref:Uncharacterized protein n=1 Tax=Rotaria socialis TaxID=392032 RepID=A0A818NR27_9BILA|nr:unnamed protein product [Rotaria socialis]